MASRVAVIGGGLAGITAALDCADAGAQVTLLEVRRRLGGAAYSVQRDGLTVDNGQHVFLRCCLAYRALLARIASEHNVFVQARLEIPVLSPGHGPYRFRRGSLPAPLQLSSALLRYPRLSIAQRLGAARAALALMRLSRELTPERARALDDRTLGDWLARHGQGPEAVAALWDLIALPTLNLPAAQASLGLGAFVFREGLFASADAADIGFHRATLSQTIGEPAARALRDAGVQVRMGWRAETLQRAAAGLEIEGSRGREAGEGGEGVHDALQADAVIVALPHARAASLIEPLLGDVARRLRMLDSSPIVNLHVVYDREVCEEPFAAGVGTPVQYVFDRSRAGGAPPDSQYLAVSLSGADREMGMSVDELRERYLPAMRALFPAPARLRCRASWLPVSTPRRFARRRAPRRCARPAGPRSTAFCWLAPGLTPAGRRRSRGPCSAAMTRRAARWRHSSSTDPRRVRCAAGAAVGRCTAAAPWAGDERPVDRSADGRRGAARALGRARSARAAHRHRSCARQLDRPGSRR